MPVEEFRKCTGHKKHKLFERVLETITKFSKRLNIHNVLLSELRHSKNYLSNINLTKAKSYDNINFMRYYDENSYKNANSQENVFVNSNKWEILSQINHTPHLINKNGNVDQSLSESHRLGRYKSMNDLIVSNGNRSVKHLEKLNSLLDFVMGQMLDYPYKDSDKILKSIQDLIIESGVQIVVQLIYELNESISQRYYACNPNYLRVICSPETSSSESDTLPKHNWLPIDTYTQVPNTPTCDTVKENTIPNKKVVKNSNIVCIPNAHIDKGIKHRLNMKNISSPSFRESSAFKYSSKSKKILRRTTKNHYLMKDQRYNVNSERKQNGEYSCYITAKKASSQQPSKLKKDVNVSVYSTKCSLENNHAVNLSPIVENKLNENINNIRSSKVTPSKSVTETSACHRSATKSGKSKKFLQIPFQSKKTTKFYNSDQEKPIKTETNPDLKTEKSVVKPHDNIQITKAASVDCFSNEQTNIFDKKLNIKVLSIKYNEDNEKPERNLKITPINFIFAGENINDKSMTNESIKVNDTTPIQKLRSVVSNLKYSQKDIRAYKSSSLISEPVSFKSKTTFGIDSGYTKKDKQNLQISNYFLTKNNLENDTFLSKKELNLITFNGKNSMKNKENWMDYILKAPIEDNLYSKLLNSPKGTNIRTISMVNNNNDRTDIEISENEQPNTDSSCTFHAVRAKYFKQYFPNNCETESVGNENMISSTNESSQFVKLDPNPEEIKDIYDKVRSSSNLKQVSIGQTYSCDGNTDLLNYNNQSVINSQSFITKYNASTEDEDETPNQYSRLNTISDKIRLNNSLEFLNETENLTNLKPENIEDKKLKLQRNCNITLTSLIDVLPTLDSNNLSIFQSPEFDNYMNHDSQSINVVYCRNPLEKRSVKRYQKNIPENLLKHTFASQQKVRLKHE